MEPGSFYGFDVARILPYTLARTWHLQLAIFWIATAWVGGGLFLASWVGSGEPSGQRAGAFALLGALAAVVFGSLFGEYLGINDKLGHLWFWFGIRVPSSWIWAGSGSSYWRWAFSPGFF